ncbi:MAG TPA: NAD(P)H-dependent oxidoreductase subunit E [Candidatus Dormibacteraeota bacterium]|jgi:NADH-quinone oxidoreductase E subunit|nr:NAD(P)H-dependent oxidoreductase subunit E [Candidatus Dormibacteraeota bacterium]
MSLSPHAVEEIKELPTRFPAQSRSAVMPALDIAQEELGYLTPELIKEVAGLLDLDSGYVEGVATFYSLFHHKPVGKHRFYMCTNLSCSLRGAEDLVKHALDQVDVSTTDEVSPDGLFSVEEVECLGACEFAPMMRLDHKFEYDLTTEKLDALIAARRDSQPKKKKASHG